MRPPAGQARPYRTLQQALQVEDPVEALVPQVSPQLSEFLPDQAAGTGSPLFTPTPPGPQEHAVEPRIGLQQILVAGFGEPGDARVRIGGAQARDHARGHDDVANRAQADDQDAARRRQRTV